jgi:C2 domain
LAKSFSSSLCTSLIRKSSRNDFVRDTHHTPFLTSTIVATSVCLRYMFRFTNPSKKGHVEGGAAAAATTTDEGDEDHGKSHAPPTSPTRPRGAGAGAGTSSSNDAAAAAAAAAAVNHHPHHHLTMPPSLASLTQSKRSLKQTALAGLPRFFTKEKARVITTNDVALRSTKTWSVKMPPIKKHVVSGRLVPAVGMTMGGRLFLQRDRKICIEIYGPPTTTTATTATTSTATESISPLVHKDAYNTGEGETTPLKMGMMKELLLESGTTPRAGEAEQELVLNDNDVVVVRILRTSYSSRHDRGAGAPDNNNAEVVLDHSHSNSPSSAHEDNDDDVSTLGPESPGDSENGAGRRAVGHDVERASYRLEDVVLTKRFGRTCEVKLGSSSTVSNQHYHDSSTVVRDLKFESERRAMDFEQYLTRIKDLDEARVHRKVDGYARQRQLHASPSSSSPQAGRGDAASISSSPSSPLAAADGGGGADEKNTMINLLVEIVSATDLPVADVFSTDSYVKVRMGSTDVHRTKVLHNTRSPIWSLETDSLFLLQMTPAEFFASSNGMSFIIKDYDSIGSNTVLGRVVVSHNELLEGNGERLEYEMVPEAKAYSSVTIQQTKYDNKGDKIEGNIGQRRRYGKKKPKLYLRFKEATQEDIDFMAVYTKHKGNVGVFSDESYLAPRPPERKFLKRQTKWSTHHGDRTKNSNHEKELFYRVKPFPDPANKENTTWLTRQEIEDQSSAPSTDWLEVGSGDIGRLYVEVLRCDGLPNMDKGTLNLLDKTDAFCCLLFEDGVVNTDVIGDTLSPRWMPWSRRAFSFRIDHPQSDLIVGVFDYDPPNSPLQLATQAIASLHDPIGRCVVKLSRLLPQTEYTLTYPLYFGELDENREKARGTLTLRVRIQYFDKRKTLLAAIKPLQPSILSCPTQVDFDLLEYTSQGAEDAKAFSVATLTRHIKELQDYKKALPYLTDAVSTICLWRGHFQIHVCGQTIYVPLHSIVAFVWVILLCRSFDVFPSLLVFSIGWIFLGTNECRQRNPSPWSRTFSYSQFWAMLVANRNFKERIEPFQNHDKVIAYEDEIKQREQQREKERELAMRYEAELRKLLLDDIEDAEAEDVDITTRKARLGEAFTPSFNVLKPVLYPIQLQVRTFWCCCWWWCPSFQVFQSVAIVSSLIFFFFFSRGLASPLCCFFLYSTRYFL